MQIYLDLLDQLLRHGKPRQDRTGVGTLGLFGHQMRFDLRQGFPLLTTKKVHFRSVVHELLWFLSGSTDAKLLQDADVHIWDAWATEEQCQRFGRKAGDLGPVYGHQWRNFGATQDASGAYRRDGHDQIATLLQQLRTDPHSRRLLVSGWHPAEATQVALPPCHTLFQFHVADGELSCHLYQRSADAFLGLPFNIASYALLTHMIAQVTGLQAGDLVHSLGDVHLYTNHLEQARLQCTRQPRPLPTLRLDPVADLFSFRATHVHLEGYDPHPAIRAEVAV